ncbi:MAG: hypothetical protein AMXMBFR13_08000 [Phycisphaerae bacterium]
MASGSIRSDRLHPMPTAKANRTVTKPAPDFVRKVIPQSSGPTLPPAASIRITFPVRALQAQAAMCTGSTGLPTQGMGSL